MKIWLLISLWGLLAQADQVGCELTPARINSEATLMVQSHWNSKTPVEDNMIVLTQATATFGSDPADWTFNGEGILRPLKSESYMIFQPLLITASLSRSNDAVYICAHSDDDPKLTHVTIYFLHGYGLERSGFTNDFQNFFHAKGLTIAPLKISILGLSQGIDLLAGIFGHIPILKDIAGLPIEILRDIQGDVAKALSDFGGLGIERIVLRADNIELATGVDLNNPSKARVLKTISLKKPRY